MFENHSGLEIFKEAEIANNGESVYEEDRDGELWVAYDLYKKAFKTDPNLASLILPDGHHNWNYVYTPVEQKIWQLCPLCDKASEIKWVVVCITNRDYLPGFSPVRAWLYCKKCHHVFAYNYPENLEQVIKDNVDPQYLKPNLGRLPGCGRILHSLKHFVPGDDYLEFGFGAGEMMMAAKELGFNVQGYETRLQYIENAKSFGLEVYLTKPGQLISSPKDLIIMGDVLEHYENPRESLSIAHALLVKHGILWISTPNFDSAFAHFAGMGDSMKRVVEHINYFSRESLRQLLSECGFRVIDYQISEYFRGCMEVTAVKV